jgi:uncharacterized protein YuzE
MNVTYDPKADAMYIYFSKKKSTKTLELRDDLLVDYAGEEMVGIEVLGVSDKVARKDMTSVTLSIPAVYAS